MTKKIIPFALMLSLGAFANNVVEADNIQQAVIELLEKNVAKEEAKSSKIADGLAKAKAMYDAVKNAFASFTTTAPEAPVYASEVAPAEVAPAHIAEAAMPAPEAAPAPEAKLTNQDL